MCSVWPHPFLWPVCRPSWLLKSGSANAVGRVVAVEKMQGDRFRSQTLLVIHDEPADSDEPENLTAPSNPSRVAAGKGKWAMVATKSIYGSHFWGVS